MDVEYWQLCLLIWYTDDGLFNRYPEGTCNLLGKPNQFKVPQSLKGQNVLKLIDFTMFPTSVIQRKMKTFINDEIWDVFV